MTKWIRERIRCSRLIYLENKTNGWFWEKKFSLAVRLLCVNTTIFSIKRTGASRTSGFNPLIVFFVTKKFWKRSTEVWRNKPKLVCPTLSQSPAIMHPALFGSLYKLSMMHLSNHSSHIHADSNVGSKHRLKATDGVCVCLQLTHTPKYTQRHIHGKLHNHKYTNPAQTSFDLPSNNPLLFSQGEVRAPHLHMLYLFHS